MTEMASGSTRSLQHWEGVASEHAKGAWRDRAQLAATFIRSGDVVCDLGAGSQPLRLFLPEGAKYLAVDCVDTIPGTHVADFDRRDFTLPAADFNVLSALGVVDWLQHQEQFLARLAEIAQGKFIVFTYDLWRSRGERSTLQGCITAFSPYIRNLTPAFAFRRRVFFTGTLGRSETNRSCTAPVTNIYLKYLRPQEYLMLKLFKLHMMPRWLA
jgi:hypothetical protein